MRPLVNESFNLDSRIDRPAAALVRFMASFYGNSVGLEKVTKNSITEALGFTPSSYALVMDEENNVMMLKSNNDTSFSNQIPLLSFGIRNDVPTLYVKVG